jgi:putative transposase
VPIGVVITAANTPDKTALAELLDARPLRPLAHTVQHLCLDKGYDYADAERAARWRRYVPHIRRRGEERRACRRGTRARRPAYRVSIDAGRQEHAQVWMANLPRR